MYKHPWLAVFLSVLFPGVGQIYGDRRLRGIVFISFTFFLYLLTITGFLLFFFSDDPLISKKALFAAAICLILTIFILFYNLFDAYIVTKKFNTSNNLSFDGKKKPWFSVFLSYIIPGIGHFYNGNVIKGILFVVSVIILLVLSEFNFFISLLLIPFYLYVLKDAHDSAEKINGSGERFVAQGSTLAKVFVVVFIVLQWFPFGDFVKAHIGQAFKLPAASMIPSLFVGDHILTNKLGGKSNFAQKGNIIVFRYPEDPERDFIKRVIATEGDVIEGKNKMIYINGVPLYERYVQHVDRRVLYEKRDNFGPLTVPEGNLFVMGDNRDQSYDSRYWGFVPIENVKAQAVKIYWSWDKENHKVRWDRIGMTIE